MSRMMVMAGGTGGHVMPALAVARCLRERGVEVRWMGSTRGLESRLVAAEGFDLDAIHILGLRHSGLGRKLVMPFLLLVACSQALWILLRRKPDVLLGMGGFVSGPGGLVAGLLSKPLILHEQNAVAGLTNRWLARVASRVLTGFPATEGLATGTWVGNPVRSDIAAIDRPRQRLAGRSGPFRILVVGGSQGARAFNRYLPDLLARRSRTPMLVRHQAGHGESANVRAAYGDAGIPAEVSEFIEDMSAAYAWSDAVICRAGAMTVAEICAAGGVAFFVPYPHAVNDHQARNAEYLTGAGAAITIRQEEFLAGDWLDDLDELASDRRRLVEMAEKARSLAKADAAARVADICGEMVHA